MRRTTLRALSSLLLLCAGSVNATDSGAPWSEEEFEQKIRAAQVVSPLTSELFGEHVSLYDGSTSFEVTDVDLPGNNALPVRIARKFKIDDRHNEGYIKGFSDWEIEVPHLEGIFESDKGWVVQGPDQNARCSAPAVPVVAETNLIIGFYDIWSGYFLHVPGEGDQEMLVADSSNKLPAITDGKTYPWVTSNFYRIRCLPSTASGYPGEAFVAISPTGTEYTFNYVVSIPANGVAVAQTSSQNKQTRVAVARSRVAFLATHVQDRFGNYVDYHYSGDHLTSITASDGRAITLAWTGETVTSVTANGRTWTYAYTPVTGYAYASTLASVTQPDNTQWTYSAVGTLKPYRDQPQDGGADYMICPTESDARLDDGYSLTITSPSGATGEFGFSYGRTRRTHTPVKQCMLPLGQYAPTPYAASYWDNYSLASKTISGPGIATQTWQYEYPSIGTTYYTTGSATDPCSNCTPSKAVTVHKPDGTYDRYTYGVMYGINDGQLLKVEHSTGTGAPASTTTTSYVTNDEVPAQRFPATAGSSLNLPYSIGNHLFPVKQTTTIQDGGTFTSTVTSSNGVYSFDAFGRSTQVQKTGTDTKTENTEYFDDRAKWVLGLVTRQWLNSDASYLQNSYNANDQVATISKFGQLQYTLGYNADGTLSTLSDGRDSSSFDTTITLSNWKRGIPQNVHYPATPEASAGATESAVVDDNGWIQSVTDELGYTTSYAYDPIGRLKTITYPAADSVAWNVTSLDFAPVASSEFGIPAGHWRQTVSTGNARTVTYYDALWRPVLAREYDAANVAATDRYTATSYELGGQSEFTSFPIATAPLMDRGYWVTSVGSSAPTTSNIAGTHTFYDALDRVVKTQADSEQGALTTTRAYLHSAAGNYTQVTDPNLNKTSTWFQSFDQPSEDAPTSIALPEGVNTDIVRDDYGKPLSITRHDAANSVTEARTYAYDAAQRLCRSVEPESGATLMGYDAIGDLLWSAAGLPATTPCDTTGNTAAVLARKASRSYDARKRLQSLTFADGWSDTSFTYFADGALASVTALNGGSDVVTTSYSYNKRRLPTSERMQWGTVDWSIGYGYDQNGALASQTYPGGLSVPFLPNALGQPTQAGTYATGVSYWPNGGMKQFTYGNGIVHTLTQNARGLPDRSLDTKSGASAVLDDSYDYDANGNVMAISDGRPGNRGNRDMTYDGLNRLKTATSPMFNGTVATYTYDVLDNLRTVKAPGRDQTYLYDPATWQLTSVKNNADGSTVVGLGYDVQGNLANKNGMQFTFDLANRLRSVAGMASSTYVYDGHGRRVRDVTTASKYSLYSKPGQLVYDNNQRTGVTTSYIYLNGSLVAQDSDTTALGVPVLTAPSSDTTGSYTVSWNALATANRYDLQERFNGGAWIQVYSGTGTSAGFTSKALGTWDYRVRACADAACGSWSSMATVTESAPTPPPATAPTLNVPATGLNGSYAVSWTSVSGATSYTLEESANGGAWTTAYTGAALTTSFSAKAAGSYAYRVKACNSSGCSAVSATGTVQVIYPPASAPTLTVPATSYNGSYTVSWTAVSSATSYSLEESVNGAAWATAYTGSGLSKAYSSAAAGSHAYRVTACNAAGCSATSAASTVQVTYPPATAPTVTAPATNGTGAYTVSWTSVSGATSYTLDESVNGGAWTQIQSGTTLSRAISGKGDGSYAYRAKACNVAGCSAVSASVTTVVNIPPPATPSLQVPPNPDAGYAYTVTWTGVATATSYQLDEYGTVWTNVYNGTGTSASFTHGAGNYSYRVRACNAKGCSPYSAAQTAVVQRMGCPTCLLPSGPTHPSPRKSTPPRKGGK